MIIITMIRATELEALQAIQVMPKHHQQQQQINLNCDHETHALS